MSDVAVDTAGTTPRRLFAAFEGGGAKGLVHIGALKALESRGFDFNGVAGTSAGAVVAALKAAGYQADELVDPDSGRTIFDRYEELTGERLRPTDLFGPLGWQKIRLLQMIFGPHGRAIMMLIVVCALLSFLILLLKRDVSGLHYMSAGLLVVCLLVSFPPLFFLDRGGIVSLRTCRDILNRLISAKLFPDEPHRIPVLGDFRRVGRPSLRVVGADITTRKLRLFSSDSEEDAHLSVADIVAASVCIPLVFRPWDIGGRLHVDGGIVSNLPAWPFDEERALDLDALTLGFEIEDRGLHERRARLESWIVDVAITAAFGASVLNTRAVDRLHVFRLATDLNTLDFDVSLGKALEIVRQAGAAADALIAQHIIDVPALYIEGCRQVQKLAMDGLLGIPGAIKELSETDRMRVCVAMPQSGFRESLRLLYSVGFEGDADEGILLPQDGSYIGHAWRAGESILATAPFEMLPSVGSRRLNKLFAKDIRWILAAPVYGLSTDQEQPDFVVALDGSHLLNDEDDAIFDSILDLLPQIVDDVFVPIAAELAKKRTNNADN